MGSVFEAGKAVQDQALEALRTAQEAVIEALGTVAERGREVADAALAFDAEKQLSALSGLRKEDVPSAADVINSSFDFVERVVASQREFANRIVNAAAAARPGAAGS